MLAEPDGYPGRYGAKTKPDHGGLLVRGANRYRHLSSPLSAKGNGKFQLTDLLSRKNLEVNTSA